MSTQTQTKPLSVDSTGRISTTQLDSGTTVQPSTTETPTSGSRTSTVAGAPTSTTSAGFTGFQIAPPEANMSVGRTTAIAPISTAPTVVYDRTAGATKQNAVRTQAATTPLPSAPSPTITIQDQSGNKLVVSQDAWDKVYSQQQGRYTIAGTGTQGTTTATPVPAPSPTPTAPTAPTPTSQTSTDQQYTSDDGGNTWRLKTAAELAAKPLSTSETVMNEYIKSIQALNRGISAQEEDQAQAAGRAAGAQYDPLIKKAQEEKKQGMAKGLIRAGQAGGFLSSQMAGVASFAETEGGTWVGAGGVLERMQDEYSGAIASLEAAKMAAVQQAEAAQRKAIRTGKQEDLDNLTKAFSMAQAVEDQKAQKARDSLNELKILNDIAKQEKEDAFSTASNLSKMGYKPEEIPKSYLEDLDQGLGAPGAYTRLYNMEQTAKSTKTVGDQISAAKDLVGLLNDIPAGKSITVGGVSYMGMNKGAVKTGTETDAQGRVSFWEYNPDTQKTTTTNLGYIGKPSDGWTNVQTDQGWVSYNTKTNQSIPLQPSINTQTIQALVPEGSRTNPFKPGAVDAGVQCGEWMNYVNDPSVGRIWGDSLEQKLAVANRKDWSVPIEQAEVGDTVVQGGSWTGHVFRILDEKTDPANGRKMWQAFEANIVPPGGGAITSTRWVYADDPKNKAAARIPTRAEFMAGTDSAVSSNILGTGAPTLAEIQTSRAEAVQELMGQGVNDPSTILNYLNFDEQGNQVGDFDIQEVRSLMSTQNRSSISQPTIGGRPISEVFGGGEARSWASGLADGSFKITDIPQDQRAQAREEAIRMGWKPGQIGSSIKPPSFEEFYKEASNNLNMSLAPEMAQTLYKRTVGSIPDLQDAISVVASGLTEAQSKGVTKSVNDAIGRGDFQGAREQIKKAAVLGAGTAEQEKIRGRDAGIEQLSYIQDLLTEFKNAGGSTNIFKGTEEQIKAKAGTVGDARLRQIASSIALSLIDYRKSVSGAAFTESEGAEYRSLFPSIGNTYDLNIAKIDGLLNSWERSNDAFYRSMITPSLYEAIYQQ